MKNQESVRLYLIAAIAAALATLNLSAAVADQTIALPEGWRVCPYFFSANSQSVVVGLFPSEGDPFYLGSRLMQTRGSTTIMTNIPGKIFFIQSSPDGSYVLVSHENSPEASKTSLVSGVSGEILWTKSDDRNFRFSGTGEVVYAYPEWAEHPLAKKDLEIYGLDGVPVSVSKAAKIASEATVVVDPLAQETRVVDAGSALEKGSVTLDVGTESVELVVSQNEITGAVVLGDGQTALFAMDGKLHSLNTAGGFTMWRTPYGSGPDPELVPLSLLREPRMVEFIPLGASRVLVKLPLGYFKVIGSNGSVEYTYDPAALATSDPSRTFMHYASYHPYPTPDSGRLFLFREMGSQDGLLLNISGGSFTPISLNLSVPEGFKQIPWISGMKMVFYSTHQIIIRAIPY